MQVVPQQLHAAGLEDLVRAAPPLPPRPQPDVEADADHVQQHLELVPGLLGCLCTDQGGKKEREVNQKKDTQERKEKKCTKTRENNVRGRREQRR